MWRDGNLARIVLRTFHRLPCPINLNYFWNFRSTLRLVLRVQIVTGLLLTIHYSARIDIAFESVSHIERDVNYGWLIRPIHANGARFFLGLIYLHVRRGIFYKRYINTLAWLVGVALLVLSIRTAFLGYVLPWRQISYWAATVITNLLSVVPYRPAFVEWVWRGFSVNNPTLMRFYTFHFLFPFVLAFLAILHLVFIHDFTSRHPLGRFSAKKIDFWPYFRVKDIFRFIFMFLALLFLVFFFPQIIRDVENYKEANPLVTPAHIKPEWYFLFAYTILRCIPNKAARVAGIFRALRVLALFPLGRKKTSTRLSYRLVFFCWVINAILLTWLGGCPVKEVYVYLSQICSVLYFRLIRGLLAL